MAYAPSAITALMVHRLIPLQLVQPVPMVHPLVLKLFHNVFNAQLVMNAMVVWMPLSPVPMGSIIMILLNKIAKSVQLVITVILQVVQLTHFLAQEVITQQHKLFHALFVMPIITVIPLPQLTP